ncbi:VOC family protein [Fangia hongkongensis]|uniref:VOC family protein n=1 Tax=Fangia hongkongensis TaxID=270495 RepID=UPI00036056A4|nr:VOC family protein [Fangia hongkongensis]MBK2124690.1 VOC family protein [Fangia hongkongensis]
MHLEHINLVVKNLEQSLLFYKATFPHWKIRSLGESNWYQYKRKWLHFGDDYQYIALSDHGAGDNRDLKGNQVGLAHFAYVVHDIQALEKRMLNAGFKCSISITADKFRKKTYYIDPDGFEIEFVQYTSDLPDERNAD